MKGRLVVVVKRSEVKRREERKINQKTYNTIYGIIK